MLPREQLGQEFIEFTVSAFSQALRQFAETESKRDPHPHTLLGAELMLKMVGGIEAHPAEFVQWLLQHMPTD